MFVADAGMRIKAEDRSGLERLLRYCARLVFAFERLRQIDPEHLVYEGIKPGPGGSVSLLLTPLELIKCQAALIPPPRRHRHRYYGMLAPNAPLRAAVTALAVEKDEAPIPTAVSHRQLPKRRTASPSGKPIRRPSRHQTTNSTSASPGRDGQDQDKGWGLLRDDSCLGK